MLFDYMCWCVDFSAPILLVIAKPLRNRLLISYQLLLVARLDKAIGSGPLRRNWEADLGLAKAGTAVEAVQGSYGHSGAKKARAETVGASSHACQTAATRGDARPVCPGSEPL